MTTKLVFRILAGFALILSVAALTFGQAAEMRGHVVIVQADGQTVPASEALIDVYRTDISGKYNTKANKKGEFVFAGLPLVGTYVIVASHPTAKFDWLANVKIGRGDDFELKLSPGDGKRPTQEEIKELLKQGGGAPSGGSKPNSAADKAAREEALKKNKEIEEANKKIEASNTVVSRTFEAGNAALVAKNYEEAIKQYDEGIAADPLHPAQSVLLTQKAQALKARGVQRYNAAIGNKDDAAKAQGFEAAKGDFRAAAETAKKAVDFIKAQPAPVEPQQLAKYNQNKLAALGTKAEAMRLFVTKVDQSQVDAGQAAYEEYLAADQDPARKTTTQRDFAQMLFDANAFDKALVEYKKILDANPEDTDALVKTGMLLFNIGALNNDKVKYQEAANYLQQFVDKAPDTDTFKADAKAILDELKNQQNVKAEKTTTSTPTRRRRP